VVFNDSFLLLDANVLLGAMSLLDMVIYTAKDIASLQPVLPQVYKPVRGISFLFKSFIWL
jgi:hypothetical protein